ncbi:MAG: hypothetical protein WBQ78_05545 [Gammaproteobacteria bacterium]
MSRFYFSLLLRFHIGFRTNRIVECAACTEQMGMWEWNDTLRRLTHW